MAEPYMTIAEIEAKYPNEWVLVDKLKKGRDGMAVGGTVVVHSPEREAVYRAAGALPVPRDVAIFHTGPIPEDALFIL
jgi:signal peptidase I